jgi:hypothetical protein
MRWILVLVVALTTGGFALGHPGALNIWKKLLGEHGHPGACAASLDKVQLRAVGQNLTWLVEHRS